MSYEQHLIEDARLVILKELSAQPAHSLNETIIVAVLDRFGHRRSRDWLRTQLRKLEDIGALTLVTAGSVFIATLKRAGLDHVERRAFLEGVARPSPES